MGGPIIYIEDEAECRTSGPLRLGGGEEDSIAVKWAQSWSSGLAPFSHQECLYFPFPLKYKITSRNAVKERTSAALL